MSKRAPQVSVLTANRLADGTVVFLAPDGTLGGEHRGRGYRPDRRGGQRPQAQGRTMRRATWWGEPYLAAVAGTGACPAGAHARARARGGTE